MENTSKTEFRFRLPTTRIYKWYELDGKSLGASLEVEVWNKSVSITVNHDTSEWKVDNLQKVAINIDTGFFIFNLLKDTVETIGENEKLKIPIVKPIKDDKGKSTGDTIAVADIVFGRNDKEYFLGILFKEKPAIKFIFQPPVPNKQWYIAKNDNIVDTVLISKIQAKSWIGRVLEALKLAEVEYLKQFNQKYNPTLKASASMDGSVAQASYTTDAMDLI
nr:MAG TPA: hypothetical protein [Caudoviricetes sp.]